MRRCHRHEVVTQSGTITAVQDCGTIVLVQMKTERGWLTPVFFDHRPFRHLLEAEGCRPQELIGRRATFDGESLRLLD